jgi:BON domain
MEETMINQNDDGHSEHRLAPTGDYPPGESGFVDPKQEKAVTTSSDRDGQIIDEISNRLRDDPALDASGISVKVEKGDVILTGQVTDDSERLRAVDCALQATGVIKVRNDLQIRISGEGSVMTQA